jgi:uncharacterized repeat protein (TIGR01451 family)
MKRRLPLKRAGFSSRRLRTVPSVEMVEARCLLTNFPVTVTTDGGAGSLRQAIINANAKPGPDTITLPAGTYTLTIAPTGSDDATTGDLNITDDLTINGAGAATTIIDGGALDGVFRVTGNITANFSGVTIRNGGGVGPLVTKDGIKADLATINVTDSVVTGNVDDGINTTSGNIMVTNSTLSNNGDGISTMSGTVTASGSTFSGNTFDGISAGNGVMCTNCTFTNTGSDGISAGDNVTATGCTFSGTTSDGISAGSNVTSTNCTFTNTGSDGISAGGPVTVSGCTFTGTSSDGVSTGNNLMVTNSAFSNTGSNGISAGNNVTIIGSTISGSTDHGISCGSSLSITNSTISGNTNGISCGDVTLSFVTIANNEVLGISTGTMTIGNTILSAPSGGMNYSGGTITSLGHNISSDHSCAAGFTKPGDLNNTNPKIGPLANNGGPTLTHALLPGSPAIDAASSVGAPATDQRGVARPQGPGFDIGAFELEVAAPSADLALTTFSAAPRSVLAGQTVTYTIAVQNKGPSSASNAVLSVPIPDHTTFVSFTAPAGWTPSTPAAGGTGSVTASRPSLADKASASFTLVVRVDPGTPANTTISAQASVSAVTADPSTNNNALTAMATVTAPVESIPPTVVALQRFGFHTQPTLLVLTFSEPLDPATAQNTRAYRIIDPHGHTIVVDRAMYDPEAQTVTLFPHRKLNLHLRYRLIVSGTGPNAVTNAEGVPLDGANNGRPGSDFVTFVTIDNWVRPLRQIRPLKHAR